MTDRNFYWPCPYGCTMLKQYIQNVETLTEENKRLRKIIDKRAKRSVGLGRKTGTWNLEILFHGNSL